ncbi:unnamed protein product [Cylindrotheca closterium]|uniref:Uncharacterized protein n=1 Tax=Cylindrotheca closterium TaxID=2856 RepID=A0AAD2FVF9_9STRA|nr:unnamed protein product [Cylindrotheca closterium]
MADQQDKAFANIAQTLQLLQQMLAAQAAAPIAVPAAAAPPAVAVPPTPILDSFDDATPFDISSRQGSAAVAHASAPLRTSWSGVLEELFQFAKHTARVDPRAIQNSRCLYNCLASSITGDLRIEIFGQPGNLPTHGDGPPLLRNLKWHTHPTADCKIRKAWLEEKAAAAAVANAGDVQSKIPIEEGSAASNANSGVTALLANALLMIGDDDALHDVISEALSALHQT